MSPVVSPQDTRSFLNWATTSLQHENASGHSALILIEDGEVVGEFYQGNDGAINAQTVFSAASMSKWIAATAIMRLVVDGRLDLDAPVSDYLSRWELPRNGFDPSSVTIRRLLSHTAGFTDGLGFGDYGLDETLPTLVEELSSPRASSGQPVQLAVNETPGSAWRYSGGSYLLLELVIEEVSNTSYEKYVQRSIFDPLCMQRSTYASLDTIKNNAGSIAPGGGQADVYQYASSAATAFATSASDLSNFVLAQIPESDAAGILPQETINTMRQPHASSFGTAIWGLGTMLYAPTAKGEMVYGHDGGNSPAINTTARINPDNGDALILLLTGHPALATMIGSQWVLWQTGIPDFLNIKSVIASMIVPAASGSLLLLILFGMIYVLGRSRGG